MESPKNVENNSKWFIGGGIAAAVVASLCCVGPLLLTLVGISGVAVLSKLDVLRGPMIVVVIAMFGFAGYMLFKKRNSCDPRSICSDPKKFKKMVVLYFIGLAVSVVGVTSPYWIGWVF